MRCAATLLIFSAIMLASCVPVAVEASTPVNSCVVQSVATLRDGNEITFIWSVSGGTSAFTTWVEFYAENNVGFLVSPKLYVNSITNSSQGVMLLAHTLLLEEIASFHRQGTIETFTLLFRIAVQPSGGRTIHSEFHQTMYFNIVTTEDER